MVLAGPLSIVTLLASCSADAPKASNADEIEPQAELQPAEEVNGYDEADQAVTGTLGVPARLFNELDQDVMVTLRSADVVTDEPNNLLVVDVRVENATGESQSAPEFTLMCGDAEMSFYGGTFEWQSMPPDTFLEGTREFDFPETCVSAELRATPLVNAGESIRWTVAP